MIVPVKKLSIITLSDNEQKLLETLGRLGVIQLRTLDETAFVGFKEVASEETRDYESLQERFRSIQGKLGVTPEEMKVDYQEFNRVKASIGELQASIEEFEKKVSAAEARLGETKSRSKILSDARSQLRVLKAQGVNPGDIGDFKHIFARAGILETRFLPSLRLRFQSRKDLTFKEAPTSPKESFLYITGLVELKPWSDKLLAAAEFREFKLPTEIPGDLDGAINWVDKEAKKVEEEIRSLEGEWKSLRRDFADRGGSLDAAVKYSLGLSLAQSHLLRSKMLTVLQGWIPKDRIAGLNAYLKELNEKVGGSIEYSYDEPLPDEEIPTVMKNPKLFGAYETLTRQYGLPDPRESDPTIISTILWTTMFGIMFADFGQGIVILGLGAIFAFVLRKSLMGINFARLGRLMIGLGLSAILFGLLAGEFFLTEVHPLWPGLKPGWAMYASNVVWLIKISIFFGIAQITLALFISIRNHLKTGEKLEALLGERGVAGLITFLGIVIVAFGFLGVNVLPRVGFPELGLGVLRHWTIAMPIAGVVAIAAKPIISGEGATMSIGVVIETLISSLANMLSYTRIAGFSIAHAAFALVVAELLHANPVLGIGLGLIFLNVFALTLELMVVMIQALRLLYYEFSTKFFRGTGTPYSPYRIGF